MCIKDKQPPITTFSYTITLFSSSKTFLKYYRVRIKVLDKLNLVKLTYGDKVLGSS